MTSYVKTLVDLLELKKEYLVLDTETSGLKGEIVELTIIRFSTENPDPEVLFDSKIKTKNPIEPESSKIHHVYDKDVVDKNTWLEIREKILGLTKDQIVLTYNALFDRKAFHHSDAVWSLPRFDWKSWCQWRCIMLAAGDLLTLDPNLRWFKLFVVAEILDISTKDLVLHSSMGDTILAGRVMRFIIEFFRGRVIIPKK